MKKVIILGGGISGLTAAYRLKGKANVSLYEASDRVGGLIQTIEDEGFLMEQGPDCFLSENPSALNLAKDLGLEAELIGTIPDFRKSFIVRNQKLYPVPTDFYLMAPRSLLPFAFSPILSVSGKLRALQDLWIPKRVEQSEESLADFVNRRLGKELLDRIAQPMIAGIYTADARTLSLSATMPKFQNWEKEYGSVIKGLRAQKKRKGTSGPRYGLFVTFKKGLETLVRALSQGDIFLKMRAERMEKIDKGWRIQFSDGSSQIADQIILALPAHISARLVKSISPTLAQKLGSIQYGSSGTIHFIFKKDQILNPIDGVGFVIPEIEKKSFSAATFVQNKFEGRCPEGYAIIRTFVTDESSSPDLVYRDLQQLLKIQGEPIKVQSHFWQRSMPQYTVGHLERVKDIENELTLFPGLHLTGNSFHGIGIPGAISSAETVVQNLLKSPN